MQPSMWDTAESTKVTEQGAGTVTTDFGAEAFRAVRVIVYIKTPPVAGDYVTFTVQVGTGAAVTSPRNIAQVKKYMLTGDTTMEFQIHGVSQALFRSCNLVASVSADSIVYDAFIQVA
jgi:hypothetical protein